METAATQAEARSPPLSGQLETLDTTLTDRWRPGSRDGQASEKPRANFRCDCLTARQKARRERGDRDRSGLLDVGALDRSRRHGLRFHLLLGLYLLGLRRRFGSAVNNRQAAGIECVDAGPGPGQVAQYNQAFTFIAGADVHIARQAGAAHHIAFAHT